MPSPRITLRMSATWRSGSLYEGARAPTRMFACSALRRITRSGGPDGGVAGSAGAGVLALAPAAHGPIASSIIAIGVSRVSNPPAMLTTRVDGSMCFARCAAAVVGGERQDGLLAPGDVPAQRVIRPHQRVERDLHVVLRVVLVHAQLFDDHLALFDDLGFVERGAEQHVAEDRHGQTQLRRGDTRPEDGGLAIGRGVEHPADALDGLADITRGRISPATLEHHVLDEVADAALRLGLVARADCDHEGDRHRGAARQRDGREPGPPGEGFDAEFGQYDRPDDRPGRAPSKRSGGPPCAGPVGLMTTRRAGSLPVLSVVTSGSSARVM